MMLLDHPRPFSRCIQIPLYHRAPLSLYPGTDLYLAADLRAPMNAPNAVKLVGTTVPPSAWQHSFRVSACLKDQPGAIHGFLNAVARHGGRTLSFDGAPSSARAIGCHELEALVDFAQLDEQLSDTLVSITPDDVPRIATNLLAADCFGSLSIFRNGRASIKVRPVRCLQRTHRIHYDKCTSMVVVGDEGRIELPDELIEVLGEEVEAYAITTDTKERILRIHLMSHEAAERWCAIHCDAGKDTLSRITGSMLTRGFNLITALSRPERSQRTQWFEALVSSPGNGSEPSPGLSSSPEEQIRRAVSGADAGARLFFDFREVRAAMDTRSRNEDVGDSSSVPISLDDWLRERETVLDDLRSNRPVTFDRQTQAMLADEEKLRGAIHNVKILTGRGYPDVFVSIAYDGNQKYIDAVREVCQEFRCTPRFADRSTHHHRIRPGIVRQIADAELFLGIWTWSTHSTKESDSAPSPWCLWEAGVAEAYNMEARIVIEDRVNSDFYKALYKGMYSYDFRHQSDESFRRAVGEALESFAKMASSYSRRSFGADPLFEPFGMRDDPC